MTRWLAIFLAGAMCAAPVLGIEVRMTAEEAQACAREGGCRMVTERWLRAALQQATAQAKQACDART